MTATWPEGAIFTVGHSTLPIAKFIALLDGYGIQTLADIRTVPRSRHNPQFNSDALARALEQRGIAYLSLQGLGGLRRPRKDSPNTGWRVAAFRAYADFMLEEAFARIMEEIGKIVGESRASIMCAEAVPWRCHRQLLADAFLVRGWNVRHIMDDGCHEHQLTKFAEPQGTQIYYRGKTKDQTTTAPKLF